MAIQFDDKQLDNLKAVSEVGGEGKKYFITTYGCPYV